MRSVALITPRNWRRMRSSSRFGTWSSAPSIAFSSRSACTSRVSPIRGSKRSTNSSTSCRAIAGLPVSARSIYASLKVEPTCRRYFAYARRIVTSRALRCARSTRRLKSSFSIRPLQIRSNASSNRPFTRSMSNSVSSASSRPKSCTHACAASCVWIRYGRSSSTRTPRCSSIGRLRDSAIGSPARYTLKRNARGSASIGRYRFIASWPESFTRSISSMSRTAVRAG